MLDFIDLPKGNGQVVYINLELLRIDRDDVIYNSHDCTVQLLYSFNSFYEKCCDVFKKLAELGYRVILDEDSIDEETFFFTPCMPKILEVGRIVYYSNLDEKILFALEKQEITKPTTISFFDYFSSKQSLQPPFVIKDKEKHGGARKILISDSVQDVIFKEFLAGVSDEKKLFSNMVIQEYVETPTKYNTSLRVLVSSCGEVMYAALKYAKPEEVESGNFDNNDQLGYWLLNKSSSYFLGGMTIVSNTLAGGNNILLGENGYSDEEKRILIAHGIDPDNCLVPEKIRLACQEVMKNCGKELGAICGMDFIYDVKTGKWKYLEEHEFPMLQSYVLKYRLPYDKDFCMLRFGFMELDLIARMHSLSMTMKKKRSDLHQKHHQQ